MSNRTVAGDKAEATLKEAIIAVKDVEIELIRKGTLTSGARKGLTEAAADLAVYLVGYDIANLTWVLQLSHEYNAKAAEAVAAGIASLDDDERAAYEKFVAENPDVKF